MRRYPLKIAIGIMHANPPESPSVLGKPAIEKAGVLGASGKHETAAGVVYFVRAGNSRTVKIGWTSDLASRVRTLQCANSGKLKVLATIPGDEGLEGRLHRHFAKSRIRPKGEWFRLTDDLRAYINSISDARLIRWEHIRAMPDLSDDELRAAMEASYAPTPSSEIARLGGVA
jgi:hypothetical protein